MPSPLRRVVGVLGVLLIALLSVPASPASARPDDVMTVTFVRHAQSEANAAGIVDTVAPGANLTEEGRLQAKQVAQKLSGTFPDAIFASTVVRTQQTAQYLADETHEPVQVLPGLREIEAGVYEGLPGDQAAGFFDVLRLWADGDRAARIPGSVDGNEFDARFDDAVQTIWDGGYANPVAFSHGAAITMWTLLNVDNVPPDLLTADLPNTGYVVVRGSPSTGWHLTDWNGRKFA